MNQSATIIEPPCRERLMRPAIVDWLDGFGMTPIYECFLCGGYCDVVGVKFGERVGRSIPMPELVYAVELKLHDIAGVLNQAHSNLYQSTHSWAAMPLASISRMRRDTREKFSSKGIGLLSVGDFYAVEIVIPAVRSTKYQPGTLYKKLWRRRNEWKQE